MSSIFFNYFLHMLYTFCGFLAGTIGSFFLGKLLSVPGSDESSHIIDRGFFSLWMFLGALVGGGIGFGYGIKAIADGTHPINLIR